MSNIEREVKILDVNPDEVEASLKNLGATFISRATQKIYVFDLMDLSSRFNECLNILKKPKFEYQYEIVREKLRGILFEIDNLLSKSELDEIKKRYSYNDLEDLLEHTPSNKLLDVFSEEGLQAFINGFRINPKKWIRLRDTNGDVAITIKHILNPERQQTENGIFQSVKETEIRVPSIEDGEEFLEQLGYSFRNYQEKRRVTYLLNGVEVDIDSWPMIPSYVEIENDSIEKIQDVRTKLGLQEKEMVSCNTQDVYKKYGIDIYQYRTLSFDSEKTTGAHDYDYEDPREEKS